MRPAGAAIWVLRLYGDLLSPPVALHVKRGMPVYIPIYCNAHSKDTQKQERSKVWPPTLGFGIPQVDTPPSNSDYN